MPNRQYRLPAQLPTLVASAARLLKSRGETELVAVLANSRLEIQEAVDYDNYGGGQTGHAVRLLVPEALFHAILPKTQTLSTSVREILNEFTSVDNEHVAAVTFALALDTVPDNWREETDALLAPPAVTKADETDLRRIWGSSRCRVFLSHRADFKNEAKALKRELAKFGVAGFVAHEDIEPTREWQVEIERALSSMHSMIALLSIGFRESNWTQQEVGIAIGRGVPVLTVRFAEDPTGFVGRFQAIPGRSESRQLAIEIIARLTETPLAARHMFDALIERWETAASFRDAIDLAEVFPRISSISDANLQRLESAHASNDQVHKSVASRRFAEFTARVRPEKNKA